MRVIAGSARSLQLKTPVGDGTRPTTDRIKETLFNMIQTDVPDAVFADLFAGSGGVGIEALSRGAKFAYFAETDKSAISCIEYNLKHTKLDERAAVLKQDAISTLRFGIRQKLDILFADPPYDRGLDAAILTAAASSEAVTADTLIIIEERLERDFSFAAGLGFTVSREKCYKTNKHVFLYKNNSSVFGGVPL